MVALHWFSTKADGSNLDIKQTVGADVPNGEGFTGIATDGTTVTNYGKITLDSASDISIVNSGSTSGFVTKTTTVL